MAENNTFKVGDQIEYISKHRDNKDPVANFGTVLKVSGSKVFVKWDSGPGSRHTESDPGHGVHFRSIEYKNIIEKQ